MQDFEENQRFGKTYQTTSLNFYPATLKFDEKIDNPFSHLKIRQHMCS